MRARVTTTALAVILLTVAIVNIVGAGRAAALGDLDHALTSKASLNALALQEYFDRGRGIALLLAHDSALRQLEPGRGPAGGVASAQASEALAYLVQLYPGRISEASLVDRTGTELARVVRGNVAPAAKLSTQEADSPFFAATMRLPPGRVYQSAPYLSPHTGQWVISNSTPMATSAGRPWGLVHFEVALDSFRATGTDAGRRRGFAITIMNTRTGMNLVESGQPAGGTTLGREAATELRTLLSRPDTLTSATLDGQRLALAQVPSEKDNANSWSVVVSAPTSTIDWSRSIGSAPVATSLAALLLLAWAGLGLRTSHRQLNEASLVDELTGLPNRRLLTTRLDQALLLAAREDTTCAVLLIDLDRFKEVNDTLGHHHGDQLLRGVADRLRATLNPADTVARLGGDEFAVLLPEVADAAAALLLAERCASTLHAAFVVEGITLNVEASIGLALAPQHGNDSHGLLRAADVAMYQAKDRKSGVVVYDPDLDLNTHARLAMLGELRRALQDGELFLHYQPKVSIDTDEVHGAEALVRWQHPTRGLVPPLEFIPVAEGTGLIMPLTLRTLDLAIAQARLWLDADQAIQVAVNLSPRCLLELDFPASVQALLDQHGLPARLLRLEITENTIMADPFRALAILTELQQSGISLSIDDFGTGYSSLSYVKHLPVDELKIDQSFITHLLTNSSDRVLVRAAIDLGHNLGLSVVAEGVEDQSTLMALAALGCDLAQGYHLARPMTAAALTDWLTARAGRQRPATISPP